MVCQDDDVFLAPTFDPYPRPLYRLEADVGSVAFIGLDPLENLDDFLLDGQGLLIEALTEARPGNAFPYDRAAPFTIYGFEMFIHN